MPRVPLARPGGELLQSPDFAALLGLTHKQFSGFMHRNSDFPKPAVSDSQYHYWFPWQADDVRTWLVETAQRRKVGAVRQDPFARIDARLVTGDVLFEGRPCRILTGCHSNGYPTMSIDNTLRPVYRWLWQHENGPVPAGLHLDHRCHNVDDLCPGGECIHRRCIELAHLEAVPPRVNILRGKSISARNAVKNICDSGHEFTDENTYYLASYKERRCRICMADAQLRVRDKRKQDWLTVRKCHTCGSDDTVAPAHPDPRRKVTSILDQQSQYWKRILAECHALCGPCYAAYEQVRGVHGRKRYEKHGCRCDICTAAARDHKRRQAARRKERAGALGVP